MNIELIDLPSFPTLVGYLGPDGTLVVRNTPSRTCAERETISVWAADGTRKVHKQTLAEYAEQNGISVADGWTPIHTGATITVTF